MDSFQHILIHEEQTSAEKSGPQLPGDMRLWGVLEKKNPQLKNVIAACRMQRCAQVAVRKEKSHELKALDWKGAFCFSGLHQVNLENAPSKGFVLLIRHKDVEKSSLETLLGEWLGSHKINEANYWVGRAYVFSESIEGLEMSLTGILGLGAKSQIFDPATEEWKIVNAGQSYLWPRSKVSRVEIKDIVASMNMRLLELTESLGISNQKIAHPLYRARVIEERSAREIPTRNLISNPLKDLLQVHASSRRTSNEQLLNSGHLSGLVSFGHDLNHQNLSSVASLADRAVGQLFNDPVLKSHSHMELFTHLPFHRAQASINTGFLYALGPWNLSNLVQRRRFEDVLQKLDDTLYNQTCFLDGHDDWFTYFVEEIIAKADGWSMTADSLEWLHHHNAKRDAQDCLCLVNIPDLPDELVGLFQKWNLNIKKLGSVSKDGCFTVVDAKGLSVQKIEIPKKKEAVFEFEEDPVPQPVPPTITWAYPDQKAPVYGFDKASMYPDQYVLKSVAETSNETQSRKLMWLAGFHSSQKAALMRSSHTTATMDYIWDDGKRIWCRSIAEMNAWADIDPEAAGFAAVDLAYRRVICRGASLARCYVNISIQYPSLQQGSDNNSQEAAYLLMLNGISKALTDYQINFYGIHHIQMPGHEQGPLRCYVQIHGERDAACSQLAPGFRMDGEVLYCVGPKPAFVDAGSTLLQYTRVVSNHTTRLNGPLMAGIYNEVHQLMKQGQITSIRAVGAGGVAETLAKMALWGKVGAQIRPTIPVIELYSGAPGRFVIGVVPQATKQVEAKIKNEYLIPLGTVGGDKILSLQLKYLYEARES